jgi:hypothetical protein
LAIALFFALALIAFARPSGASAQNPHAGHRHSKHAQTHKGRKHCRVHKRKSRRRGRCGNAPARVGARGSRNGKETGAPAGSGNDEHPAVAIERSHGVGGGPEVPDEQESEGPADQGEVGGASDEEDPEVGGDPPAEEPPPTENEAKLRWQPPELVNPAVIKLGNGYTHTSLSTKRDYIIELPKDRKVGGTWLDGGHNVVVVGGSITIPAQTEPGSANDAQRTGIYIKGATGTVHIEGVEIDGEPGAEFDGIDINAPDATVQLENLRVMGVKGGFSGVHADVVQPWGGVKDLRIDNLTATSNYQGLMLPIALGPIGSAELSRIDMVATTEAPIDKGGHMLWLTTGSNTCTAYPVSLSDVYITPRPGEHIGTAVWPASNSALSCKEDGVGIARWPDLPVEGAVNEGTPPVGDFVPASTAGRGYRSAGYVG